MNIDEVLTLTGSGIDALSDDRLLNAYVQAKNYIDNCERYKPTLQKWLDLSERKISLAHSNFSELRSIKKEGRKDVVFLQDRMEHMKEAFAVLARKSDVLKRAVVCPDYSEVIAKYRNLQEKAEYLNSQLDVGLAQKEGVVREKREQLENIERRQQCARIINQQDLQELSARIASYEEKIARAAERLALERQHLNEERERQRLEEERKQQRREEEQERLRAAEEQEQQRLEEERQRLAEEAERQRLAEEAERKRLEEEQERLRLEEEQERSRIEELERTRLEEERERARLDEERERRRLEEESERKRLEDEQKRKRVEEERERQRQDAEKEKQRLEEERQKVNRATVITDKKLEECLRWAEICQDRRRAKNKKVTDVKDQPKMPTQRNRQAEMETRRQENARKAKEAKKAGLTALPRPRLPLENRILPADSNLDETLEYVPGEFM